jgi:hypothetical protein
MGRENTIEPICVPTMTIVITWPAEKSCECSVYPSMCWHKLDLLRGIGSETHNHEITVSTGRHSYTDPSAF